LAVSRWSSAIGQWLKANSPTEANHRFCVTSVTNYEINQYMGYDQIRGVKMVKKVSSIVFPLICMLCVGIGWKYLPKIVRLPDEYHKSAAIIRNMEQNHRELIKDINAASGKDKKRELAEKYIEECLTWQTKLYQAIQVLKKVKGGHSVSVEARISRKIHTGRELKFTIQETARMLNNALKGYIDPKDLEYLEFKPNQHYKKLFPSIGE
jgi:hypothetical protein